MIIKHYELKKNLEGKNNFFLFYGHNSGLIEDKSLIVIQVNGKKRSSITITENLNEKELIDQIKNKQLISKYLDNGEFIKTIYIKDRLINFIIK